MIGQDLVFNVQIEVYTQWKEASKMQKKIIGKKLEKKGWHFASLCYNNQADSVRDSKTQRFDEHFNGLWFYGVKRAHRENQKKLKKVLTTSNRCDSIYLADAVKIRTKRQRSIKNEPWKLDN